MPKRIVVAPRVVTAATPSSRTRVTGGPGLPAPMVAFDVIAYPGEKQSA